MRDIVERLRRTAGFLAQTAGTENSLWVNEAADEIDRLRSRVAPDSVQTRPHEAPEWIWYGEDESGLPIVTFGRWPKAGTKWRYKWADIQPTEHDHPKRMPATRQVFEIVLAALNYDGEDINSLTVGEIRRALP